MLMLEPPLNISKHIQKFGISNARNGRPSKHTPVMCQRDLAIVIIATLGYLSIHTGCIHSHIIIVPFFRQGCIGKCCSVLGNASYLLVLPLRGNPLPYLIITTPFHFVLFKFKDLVAKQHPITHRHM